MIRYPKIKCIHLTDQSLVSEEPSEFKNLDIAKLNQPFRVSCQAALWRKEELNSLIRISENAWEFEEFGSKRSAALKHLYLVVSPNFVKYDEFEIIPYVFTGIIRGRWLEEVVPLFEKHAITIDYAIRGFIHDAPPKPLNRRIIFAIKRIPKMLQCWMECRRLINMSNHNAKK